MDDRELAKEIYEALILNYVFTPFAPGTSGTPYEVINLIKMALISRKRGGS